VLLTVLVVVQTLVCVVLTVALLGALRGIAELRLRLLRIGGGMDQQFRIDAGHDVPAVVAAALPDPRSTTLIAMLSDDCPACHTVADVLLELFDDPRDVVVGLSRELGALRSRLDGHVTFMTPEATAEAMAAWHLSSTPVVVVQRGGVVVGSAYGPSVQSVDELRDLWESARSRRTQLL